MLRKTLVFLAALLLRTASALAASSNFISPEELKARLEKTHHC